MDTKNPKICVIGLGYVGLPLAIEFSKHYETVGFDINDIRINELQNNYDNTNEVSCDDLSSAENLNFSCNEDSIISSDVFIVTVPTPIDKHNTPDLTALTDASELVGRNLSGGNYVIYESTVFPGATEDICVPILEQKSNLKLNEGFFVGYSPERINPGDTDRKISNIVKVTSGSNNKASLFVDLLYRSIISAGTHRAESIRVAEAAKVIENPQRDVNIALVNELSLLFERINIKTDAVLRAANTKWNFLDFRPGLVGGHCIGVDPYYLTHKAHEIGFNPELILSGRSTNDSMPKHVALRFVKKLLNSYPAEEQYKILIMGVTFKENCPDIRNSKVFDLCEAVKEYGIEFDLYDPVASAEEVNQIYGLGLTKKIKKNHYHGVIIAVAHDQFSALGYNYIKDSTIGSKGLIYDLKWIFEEAEFKL